MIIRFLNAIERAVSAIKLILLILFNYSALLHPYLRARLALLPLFTFLFSPTSFSFLFSFYFFFSSLSLLLLYLFFFLSIVLLLAEAAAAFRELCDLAPVVDTTLISLEDYTASFWKTLPTFAKEAPTTTVSPSTVTSSPN